MSTHVRSSMKNKASGKRVNLATFENSILGLSESVHAYQLMVMIILATSCKTGGLA